MKFEKKRKKEKKIYISECEREKKREGKYRVSVLERKRKIYKRVRERETDNCSSSLLDANVKGKKREKKMRERQVGVKISRDGI